MQSNWYSMVRDSLSFPTNSSVNVHAGRWKENEEYPATDSNGNDSTHATDGEQGWRSKKSVVPWL